MCDLCKRKYVTPYDEMSRAERLLIDAARSTVRTDEMAACGISLTADLSHPDSVRSYPGLPMITGYVFMSRFKPIMKHVAALAFEMTSKDSWPERSLFTALHDHSPDAEVLRVDRNGGVQRWTTAQVLNCIGAPPAQPVETFQLDADPMALT